MPNGRPGDNPFTDILDHELDQYTERTEKLVKQIIELDGKDEIRNLLWEYHWPKSDDEAKELERKLEKKLQSLKD